MWRRLLLPLVAVLALPAAARGSTVTVLDAGSSYPEVKVAAVPGEANRVTIATTGTSLTVTDNGATLQAGRNCRSTDTHTSTCPLAADLKTLDVLVGMGDRDDTLSLVTPLVVRAFVLAGDGNDRVDYSGVTTSSTTGAGTSADGGAGEDILIAGPPSGTLHGDAGNDTLLGGPRGDFLDGGAGRDVVRGGAGDDFLQEGGEAIPARDLLDGGDGKDIADYEAAPHGVRIDLGLGTAGVAEEGDRLVSIEDAIGTSHPDVVLATDGANQLDASDGDTLVGRGGDDTLDGGRAKRATLDGGAGNDQIQRPAQGIIRCGPGMDRVTMLLPTILPGSIYVAPEKLLIADCERVYTDLAELTFGAGGTVKVRADQNGKCRGALELRSLDRRRALLGRAVWRFRRADSSIGDRTSARLRLNAAGRASRRAHRRVGFHVIGVERCRGPLTPVEAEPELWSARL